MERFTRLDVPELVFCDKHPAAIGHLGGESKPIVRRRLNHAIEGIGRQHGDIRAIGRRDAHVQFQQGHSR